MKKLLTTALLALSLCFTQAVQAKVTHLLPKPQVIELTNGNAFALGRTVTITDPTDCTLLREFFTDNGCTIADGGIPVTVTLVTSIEGAYDYELYGYENESYSLEITADAINIKAVTKTGVIRAVQTLSQLAEGYDGTPQLESLTMTDWPAFKLRGYMHDVGRSFITTEELIKQIKLFSRFKINTFHWHLTENQAWRFEVKAYPQLTSNASMTRFAGQYYTQEDCKAVMAAAKKYGIVVIPEIDMPGHSEAFKRAMGYDMQSTDGKKALKKVLDEVVEVFADAPYIHIGGDEVATTAAYLNEMIAYVESKGKKAGIWNRINGINQSDLNASITQMWASSGTLAAGKPNIDCRYNYTNHFDVFADLVGIYKSNIYYRQQGDPEVAGTLSCAWNDRKTPTQEDIIIQNNVYANVIASGERAWIGGGKEYIEKGGTTLPNSGKEYDEFADFERRFLFHKANSLKNEPIAYVKQTNVRWRITEPFPNGGDMNASFAPETEGLKESYTVNGTTYGTGIATGAGIYLRHTWGNNTVPTYYGTTNHNNVTSYAWTYVYSDKTQTVGAQIEFQNYGRSEKDSAPDAGKWDRKGSRIWLNDSEILPPTWDNTGVGINNEVDLKNENFTARKPIQVTLKEGWNKVFIKLPYVGASGVRLNKWMFTFVLTDLDGKNAVEGLVYSPNKRMDVVAEQLGATITEIKREIANSTGEQPGQYSPELAEDVNAVIAEIEATLDTTMNEEERAAQLAQLNAAFETFKASLATAKINQPKASNSEVSYYYTMCTPQRENRYASSNGANADMTGNTTVSDASKWKFTLRNDGKYNIINKSNGTYVSPASSNNTALRTQANEPASGWELKEAATQGLFIIVSGSAQFNQTNNSSLGYKVYNWGSGTNTTDTGCQYLITEVETIEEGGEVTPPAEEDDVTSVEILASKGQYTASNANGTWHSRWESNEVTGFSFAASANNMTTSGDCIAGYSGQSQSSTYTITAPAGWMVTGLQFDYVNTDAGTHTLRLAIDGKTHTSTSSKQSLEVAVSDPQRTFSFVQSGENKGITFSNFIVKIKKDTRVPEIAQEIFTTATANDIPYRIPAIAMAKNGDLIAVADYRHSRADIGMASYGRIDLHARISKDNGANWGNRFSIVDGQGSSSPDFMHVGFGDPCIVADRESNRVLVLSCAGNVSFPNGTRNNHQNIARFYSEDNGATWSEPVDIADAIYAMWDNSNNHGPVRAMFIGSGKIHQSRYVKVNNYYRLYCAVLLKNVNNIHTNFVLYSDDFGGSWDVLGGVENAPVPSGGDEPKVEELPNGNVVISSRINGGRYFNIYTFTDAEKAEGSWGAMATSNSSNNGVVAQGNSCNGEIMIIPVVRNEDKAEMWLALQSLPFGNGRANVGIYYKELASGADYNTPANFAKNWDGRHQASFLASAYSTMCFQKDSTIAFLYEEDTYGINAYGGYNIIYKNYSLEQITNGKYSVLKGREPEAQPDQPSDATIAMVAEAKSLLKLKGVGYPATEPRETLKAAIAVAEENPTESAGSVLEAAIEAYLGTTDVQLPADGEKYTLTMVAKNGNRFYLNYTGDDIAMVARGDEELPESAQFLCKDNGDGTVTLTTNDGKYLVYHTKYAGVDWLQNRGDTDGLQDEENDMTKITFAKIENINNVVANDNKDVFGMLTWYSKRGYDTGKNEECYGYMVLKSDGSDYDGASAPFWNDNYSSAFLVEKVVVAPVQYRIKSVSQNKYLNIEAVNMNNATGPKGSVGLANYAENNNQIFTFEDADDDKVYIVSAEGYYIVCRQWNIDASNQGLKSPLGIEYKNDTEFYIMNGSQYFKVGPVDGNASSYYPYCDAPFSNAELWVLEEVGAATAIEKVEIRDEKEEIFDLTGRRVNEITKAGIYIIGGKKTLVK
ncbi:MAG: family 20 glycosylhydrolase [Bacteroidaceae bacterium]|nr:family 20 glycosylhydrolase [Bacteroidaceae bacterium]